MMGRCLYVVYMMQSIENWRECKGDREKPQEKVQLEGLGRAWKRVVSAWTETGWGDFGYRHGQEGAPRT